MVSLVHTSLGSSYLIAHVLHYPPPPTRMTAHSFVLGTAVINNNNDWIVPVHSPRGNCLFITKRCCCFKRKGNIHGNVQVAKRHHKLRTNVPPWPYVPTCHLGPLFRTAGHTVRTKHGVTASAGQRRGDVEIRNYLRDQAGSRSLVFFRRVCCLLVLNSVTSIPQWIRQPERSVHHARPLWLK
jgi:hypothetical protein